MAPATFFRCARFVALPLLLAGTAQAQGDTTRATPPAGAYTEEQATRGDEVFGRVCLECHTRKEMSSADFRLNWGGRSAYDLFDRIRTTMPEAAPGSLPLDEYGVVTAYLLKLNGMPAGATPLAPDSSLVQVKLQFDSVSGAGSLPHATATLRPSARGHDARPLHAVLASRSRPTRALDARALAPLRDAGAGTIIRPAAGHPRGR